MKNMIRVEMKRAFYNRSYFFSILIGGLITGTHALMIVLPTGNLVDNYLLRQGEYPVSLFNTWIGGMGYTFHPSLFFMILPILSCIPYAESCFVDRECGYRMHILTKTDRRNYYLAKCIAVYTSGGTAVLIPLILNFTVTAMVVPALIPESSTATFPIFEHSMWSELFYTHPFSYVGGYFILIFMYSGLLALWGIIASFYLKNRYLVLLSPFIVYTLLNFVLNYTGRQKYSPEMFLRPDQPAGADFSYVCLFYIGILLCFVILLIFKGRKSEIYE